jgi:inhibitor of growth protein 4
MQDSFARWCFNVITFQIKRAQKLALEMGDQKVALAIQSYDLIDNQVQRLDLDLKRFESELRREGT